MEIPGITFVCVDAPVSQAAMVEIFVGTWFPNTGFMNVWAVPHFLLSSSVLGQIYFVLLICTKLI